MSDQSQGIERIAQFIESQTRYAESQLQLAIQVFLHGEITTNTHFQLAPKTEISAAQLERHANTWDSSLPDEPALLAQLAHSLIQKYELNARATPTVWQLLGLNSSPVREAYHALTDLPLPDTGDGPASEQAVLDHMPGVEPDVPLSGLANRLKRLCLPSGEVLFREGDQLDDGAYVITSGRVRVSVTVENEKNGHERVIAERGRGDLIGESALITNDTRMATITAIRDTEMFNISHEDFDELIHEYPQVILQITRMIARRIQDASKGKKVLEAVTNIAILPAGLEADPAEFVQNFVETLDTHFDVLHLNSTRLDRLFEAGAAQVAGKTDDEARLMNWLNQKEEEYALIIYEVDPELTEWTKRCIRQADRILLVGQADRDNRLNQIEQALFFDETIKTTACKNLVLLHPRGDRLPHDSSGWLANRPVDALHQNAIDTPAHSKSLARRLVGRPVAVVFSGGSTRGFAHIGVFKALCEAGIPIDLVGGVSAGSIVSAAIAMGWDCEGIQERLLEMIRSAKKLVDYTIPITSFIAGKRFGDKLHDLFGETLIEDLWKPYYCTSADLTAAEMCVHRRGLLWRHIRGSCSIPAVLPPLLDENGHLLVDGSLITGIPIFPMNDLAPNRFLIAADVSMEFYGANESYNFGDSMSFGKIIKKRLNPFGEKLVSPSLIDIMLRSFELPSVSLREPQLATVDVHIRPPIKSIGLKDVEGARQYIQAGYEKSCEILENADMSDILFN